jgi:hypothetical protein
LNDHPAVAEVVRQHVAIQDWLSGANASAWDSFVAALDARFEIVTPGGETVAKPALLDGFRAAFGTDPAIRIEIRDAHVVAETDEVAVVRYEEWQSQCAAPNQRVSTAVLVRDRAAPLGWAWIALQETWLGGEAGH